MLEDVFTDAEIDPVVEVIDRLEAKTDEFLAQMENGRVMIAEQGAITFTLFPVQTESVARTFAAHHVFADLCHDLIGPDARLYHDQAVYKKPESRAGSRGIKTTATRSSNRSNTSPAGSR